MFFAVNGTDPAFERNGLFAFLVPSGYTIGFWTRSSGHQKASLSPTRFSDSFSDSFIRFYSRFPMPLWTGSSLQESPSGTSFAQFEQPAVLTKHHLVFHQFLQFIVCFSTLNLRVLRFAFWLSSDSEHRNVLINWSLMTSQGSPKTFC